LKIFKQITGEYTVRAFKDGYYSYCQQVSLGFQSPQVQKIALIERDYSKFVFTLEYQEKIEGTLSVQTQNCLVNSLSPRCPEIEYFGSPLEENIKIG
jgi:hypothetical protein